MINTNLQTPVSPQSGDVADSLKKSQAGQTIGCIEKGSQSSGKKPLIAREVKHLRKTKQPKKGAQPTALVKKATPEDTELLNKYLRGQNPLALLCSQDRRDRKKVAEDTQALLDAPKTFREDLLTPSQSLKKMIRDSVHNTETFELDHEQLYERRDQLLQQAPAQQTKMEVTFETTLQACHRIRGNIGDAPLLCLNFASAKKPGGGFLTGANAQEESLARASALTASLAADPTMYQYNDINSSKNRGFYSDVMIYSPQVPVFKNDTGKLIAPYPVSFISAPAINLSSVGKCTTDQIQATRDNRAEKILSIAVARGYSHLILGAWGCGVFKNPAADVAKCFARFLRPEKKFGTVFQTVTFAMTDLSLCQEFDQHLTGDCDEKTF